MRKLTDEQVRKACEWWGEKIQAPTFDNSDDSETGAMTMMMALMAAQPASIEAAESFRVELAVSLREFNPLYIDCDYGPDRILGDAASKVGVSTMAFPWKTIMWFDKDGSVRVAEGYGAESVNI